MNRFFLVLLLGGWTASLVAAQPAEPSRETRPEQDFGEVAVERSIQLEKAIAPEDMWTQAKHGVLGQFVQAPNLLAPINPMASPEDGWGEGNLSTDTVTGRIMGLHLLKFEF